MKLMDVAMEKGVTFKVQEGFSYFQQNGLMEIIEQFVDFNKMKALGVEVDLTNINSVLKEGKSAIGFSTALSTYCLLTFVHEPDLTKDMLNDPDDPNTENYQVLGMKLTEVALTYIAQKNLLKKTPKE